jgi:hypothetical protein
MLAWKELCEAHPAPNGTIFPENISDKIKHHQSSIVISCMIYVAEEVVSCTMDYLVV